MDDFLLSLGFDLPSIIKSSKGWVDAELFVNTNLYQVFVILLLLLIAKGASVPISKRIANLQELWKDKWHVSILNGIQVILTPLLASLFFTLVLLFTKYFSLKHNFFSAALNLIVVWIIIRFSSSFVRNRLLARWIAISAWVMAALNILGLLKPTIKQLDKVSFSFGESDITALAVIKGVISLIIILWLANALARFIDRRIHGMTALTPSLRVLVAKFTRTILIIIAFMIALNTLGIDLTSLAVFSGAVGVGLGFGLQKVVSNFISGIILLLDRSIKPGDVIALGETYGWVNRLGARCVSVITRDGKEHLIPNEQLITERVENWSYSDKNVRLRIPVGISYQSDVRKALELMLEVARESNRIIKYPAPNALMREFGESSLNLELRAWIEDPANGIGNISSHIMLEIFDKFNENGIKFPFPQRDIFIKNNDVMALNNINNATRNNVAEEKDDNDQ